MSETKKEIKTTTTKKVEAKTTTKATTAKAEPTKSATLLFWRSLSEVCKGKR